MNEERFDELAKAFTINRLSRGQVLKSLATGAVLGMLSFLDNQPAEAAACRRDGRRCTRNRQCCTGICNKRGRCACKNVGQSCNALKNCCGAKTGGIGCKDNRCCYAGSAPCETNQDCCYGTCCNNVCCSDGQICVDGECVCDPEISVACGWTCCNPLTEECCNGRCVPGCPEGQTPDQSSDCKCVEGCEAGQNRCYSPYANEYYCIESHRICCPGPDHSNCHHYNSCDASKFVCCDGCCGFEC